MPDQKKPAPADSTVTAVTPAFSGHNQPSATAVCPAGTICAGGGIVVPDPGMIILESRKADDGNGWYGQFAGGPSGAVATVYADCEPSSPSKDQADLAVPGALAKAGTAVTRCPAHGSPFCLP